MENPQKTLVIRDILGMITDDFAAVVFKNMLLEIFCWRFFAGRMGFRMAMFHGGNHGDWLVVSTCFNYFCFFSIDWDDDSLKNNIFEGAEFS